MLTPATFCATPSQTRDGRERRPKRDPANLFTPLFTGPNGYWNYDWFEVTVTDGHYTTIGYVYVETYTEYCGEACAL